MESTSEGSSTVKKRKTDDSKCFQCDKYLRHIPGSHKEILTREECKDMHTNYNIYLQIGDFLCFKCRSRLRLKKSIVSKDNVSFNEESVDVQSSSTNQEIESHPSDSTQDLYEGTTGLEESASQLSIDEIQSNQKSSEQSQISTSTNTDSTEHDECITSTQSTESNNSTFSLIETIPVETVSMSFSRTIASHAYCFMCKSLEDLKDVPFDARMQVFVKRQIFIPRRNRCCKKHLIKNRFYEDDLAAIEIVTHESLIETSELGKFLGALSDRVDSRFLDQFNDEQMSEERVKALTGYTWGNIFELKELMTSMRNSENRNVLQALVTFLLKLRTGNSDRCVGAILDVSEKPVQKNIDAVLKCFEKDILPKYFGYQAHSREFYISQTSPVAKILHNLENRLALICDGTYLRHQKSANNAYQRKSYSVQKKSPLVKPFTITTTNGYIVYTAGPFNANKNDATILKELLESPGGLNSILKEGDVFFLDRGFRDVISLLEERKFQVFMPALKGKENQLSDEQSNASRFVTKIRWVVEAIHGIIGQKCKLLHNQLHNSLLHNAHLYCQIACFLQNRFGKRLNSDAELMEPIIERMHLRKGLKNTFASFVAEQNWNRKTVPFHNISSDDLDDFPEMTINDLKIFFTGSYQLAQAISYLAEMITEKNTLDLQCVKVDPHIIKFEVKSRHCNAKMYKCYVHYQSQTIGISGIKQYCCNCANGNRTVGSCSHVAAIIYYLSYGRYLSRTIKPAENLTTLFDFKEIVPVINEDSDED